MPICVAANKKSTFECNFYQTKLELNLKGSSMHAAQDQACKRG
jgi:hypothetical protein